MIKQIILIFTLMFSLFHSENIKADTITINGRCILVNDSVYTIKGICYHPVPKGSDERSFGNLSGDLALMLEAGINTIRVYTPITEVSVLDEIHEAGLKVIIGFGYNQGGENDILSGTFINYINT